MSRRNIIRAWKDEEYRRSLTDAERGALPGNPAGAHYLSDKQLGQIAGSGAFPGTYICSLACTVVACTYFCPHYPV
jgi:mersacidin/lichenicidin family type 2 lantibiotic